MSENKGREGLVVKVEYERGEPAEVVINLGADDGVREGQRFIIYRLGEEVRDPVTSEVLGTLEIVRGRGVVDHVQPKLSTVRRSTVPKRVTRKPLSLGWVATEVTEVEQVPEEWRDIQVGDLVRRIQ